MKRLALSILVVDDEKNIRSTLSASLRAMGHLVEVCESAEEAIRRLEIPSFDLVLTDFRMERQTGLDVVRAAKKAKPHLLVVVMTAFASIENAVDVMRDGAWDYLPKPFTTAQLEAVLRRVEEIVVLRRENESFHGDRTRRDFFLGQNSPAMVRLEEFVRKVAPTASTLLLTGESGTGKSQLARLVHELSPRRSEPFIEVYCTNFVESLLESELFGHVAGAFTGATTTKKGKFELAARGTLFLDEIGELSPSAQTKLLRFVQDRVVEPVGSNRDVIVDTRVIAATNRDLREAVDQGKFREDLYFRLNMFELPLVPLRHRLEDVPVLLERLREDVQRVTKRATPLVLSSEVQEHLLSYRWPGNVRELRNVLERLAVLANDRPARLDDLPASLVEKEKPNRSAGDSSDELIPLEQLERRHIERVLRETKSLEQAAQLLGITTVTLWRKRKEYGLR